MGDLLQFGVFMGIVTSVGLAFRFSGVLIRRMDRTSGNISQIEDLEHRVAELEEHHEQSTVDADRILELEERLDFAERLLGQQRERTKLPAPDKSDA